MYTLYFAPGAASMCVHLALIEAGAKYSLQLVDLQAGHQRDPEYLKLNPNGVVPTLVIDGIPYREAAALLMAIADRHPQAKLAPKIGTPMRTAWYQWILYLANTVQPAFRLWFYPSDGGESHRAGEVKDAARHIIEIAWQRINAHLAENGPYMVGAEFSAADIMLGMLMRWARGMPTPATTWPALNAFAVKLKARDSWKRLIDVERLTEWS